MNLDKVSEHFEKEAFVYDELILRLIPNYEEQHDVIAKLIPFDRTKKLTALDLGCGTGILSYLILREFPNAQVTAFDLAENMLEVCRTNLGIYGDRLELKQGNFGVDEIGQGYDIILSGLSTHHLDNLGKINLYQRICQGLNSGGIFINRPTCRWRGTIGRMKMGSCRISYLAGEGRSGFYGVSSPLNRQTTATRCTTDCCLLWRARRIE